MKILTKEDILNANDIVTEALEVPEWGGKIYIRALSAEERDRFESDNYTKDRKNNYELNLKNIRARLFVLTACDQNSNRLFADSDAAALGKKNAAVIDRAFDLARKLSGITKEDVEEMAQGHDGE